ncbi:MAG: phage holin family protein [Oscillospiraceae bacterium]|nr:phage holin family protein [Oscillospiraceae bacterium]
MKNIWYAIQMAFTALGGFLGWFLGGFDGFLYALVVFVVIDYITGIMCAINDHTLSSAVGFRGICRKVLIFCMVGIGNILDVNILGEGHVLRTAVIFFYLSNEGVSMLENATHLGLPIPDKLKEVLAQLNESDGE